MNLKAKSTQKYITWIVGARDNGLSWDKIMYGNGNNDDELKTFLDLQKKCSFWDINVDDWKTLVEDYRNFIEKCGPVSISDPEDETEIIVPQHGCFTTYIEGLSKKGFSQLSIDNIEASTKDILGKLREETKQENPIRGLVMGNVQSGKTANMAGLIALAADIGYNLFIVLSGTIENLRVQTEERLYKDLNSGKTVLNFELLKNLSGKHSLQDLSNLFLEYGDKKRYLTVCLKNSTRLKNLLNWLNTNPLKKKKLKVLVIDDEADQAGINTANLDKNLTTTISKHIRNIVFAGDNNKGGVINPYKCMNYIAYTATPYANFLNEANDKSLYPKNFIATLNVPNEYFGPQQIFGSDDGEYTGLSIINEISIDDVDLLKNKTDTTIPDSLKEAICWFLCTVAVFRYYKMKKPVSMLIHTSQKQSDHTILQGMVKDFFNELAQNENFIEVIRKVWEKEVNLFDKSKLRLQYPNYGREDKDIRDYPKFEDIEETLKYLVHENINYIMLSDTKAIQFSNGVHLCVDNCYNNSTTEDLHLRLAYPTEDQITEVSPAFIVIGGSTLSRGLTLEGLTTTYFVRNSQQADTLMQMGRWFGYRRGYELLPRLWLSKKTVTQYEFLSQLDEDLRLDLRNMQMFKKKPSEYGPRLNRLPAISYLKVTSKKKMHKAIEVEGDYNDYKGQTTLIYSDDKIIENNLNNTVEFIDSLGEVDNAKFTNKLNDNSFVWLNVSYQTVFDYLSKMQYPESNSVFTEVEYIRSWYESKYNNGELGDWNVVLAGIKNSVEMKFENCVLNLPNRTCFEDDDSEKMSFGAITDPDAKKMDLDESKFKKCDYKSNYKLLRKDAGYDKTPVLVIYIINKDSTVGKTAKSNVSSTGKKRRDLHCSNHLVGYELYIPNGDENKHSSGGKITVKLDFELNSGDIDENEN